MGSSQSTVSTTKSFTIRHPQTGTTVLELKDNFNSSGSSVLTAIKLEMDHFYESVESIASLLLLKRQNMEHDHLPPYLGTTNK